ncbi:MULTISPECIES: reverse transcriptase family protein [unclassified Gilliamella]|uniref:reverse transcriptase family protein n=1 Tax=unclassified Gilliamella TaxID=2685620 RepID=UPI00226A9E6A|nr:MULTISPECIES: reverse transcriptase family protein [unclassified Gilliamella]MCX8575045.1 RNA-directed DNA polymerase [Gilliamella sp. B3831]MCX8577427.1 RNA-directed DNA polymerase [Gilliamella sp. B3815]MCX8590330.1 RNA-directed DNA polymerase [Gilliamella sp. B3812]MCX8604377.1 RNA-directed DNA polymerase [Gilliamella sp. B3823]MCX8605390.1 RNA-directed DNA polymerase [Gilliamella sp. B3825]
MIPKYSAKPVADLDLLAKILGITRQELDDLYHSSDSFFFLHKRKEKSDGSFRDTYNVKKQLKLIHARISNKFLKKVYYPDYLQGSLKDKDFLTNIKNHLGKKILITEDITNFFPSISKKVVFEVWAGFFKFSKEVSEYLAELITFKGNLVQGGKASSYICNLIFWSRENELVSYLAKRGFTYTRYVDDITVSANRIISSKEKKDIISRIYSLLKSVGAKPNRTKHHIMPRSEKQIMHNLNVNQNRPSMPKKKRNMIKAAVFECEKEFQTNANSDKYLRLFNQTMGRVNHMKRMHPRVGDALQKRLKLVKPQNKS